MNRRAAGLVLIAGAVALDVWACWQLGAAASATNDLYPRWLATRLWLTTGADPYGAATDAAIREAMGSVPLGAEGPFIFGFVYPAYVALLLAPIALLPWEAAATIWLLGIQACVLGGSLACWRAFERDEGLAPARAVLPLAVAALFPATAMNLIFLQFGALVFLGLSLGWLLLARGRERSAGAWLALALVKPSVALVPLVAAIWTAAARGGRRVVVAVAVTAGLVAAISLAVLPGWPVAFWRSTLDYASVARPTAAAGVVGRWLGAPEPLATIVTSGLAAAAILGAWLFSRRLPGDAVQAGVLAGTWLVPPLYEWNNVVLLAVLLPVLRWSEALWSGAGRLVAVALLALSALTALAYAYAPGEARLIWPCIALGAYGVPALMRLRSRYTASEGSAALPPAATRSWPRSSASIAPGR